MPNANFVGPGLESGTGAATPFWASLAVQINAIFAVQGLPKLGYIVRDYNDLVFSLDFTSASGHLAGLTFMVLRTARLWRAQNHERARASRSGGA